VRAFSPKPFQKAAAKLTAAQGENKALRGSAIGVPESEGSGKN